MLRSHAIFFSHPIISMALVCELLPSFQRISPAFPLRHHRRKWAGRSCRAMVQQTAPGASAIYAKEMERLSAKESLLLAFKDSGGFEAFVSGKVTSLQLIDVIERITSLERLNPTPRPTTSPILEGRWSFQWFSTSSPGFVAAKILFERFPPIIATLLGMDVLVKDRYAKATANLKVLNSVESKVVLTTKLSTEGPLRLKEEYVESLFETPTINDQAIPDQLKGVYGQVVNSLQQLPAPIKDAVSNGLRIPLNGMYQRFFMISYLDEEILMIRDTSGLPDVLTRLEGPPTVISDPVAEYES